jgi:hypothetical protein
MAQDEQHTLETSNSSRAFACADFDRDSLLLGSEHPLLLAHLLDDEP